MTLERLQELEELINNTDNFIDKMELVSELEDIQIRLGVKPPPKPFIQEEGCGLSCGA